MSDDIPDAKEDKDITAKRLIIKPFTIVTDFAIFRNRPSFCLPFLRWMI
jgi:hypothetical protein